jgi:hypothetical protein
VSVAVPPRSGTSEVLVTIREETNRLDWVNLGRIQPNGGLLWARYWTFRFHIMRGISWLAEELLALQEESCSKQFTEQHASCWHNQSPVVLNAWSPCYRFAISLTGCPPRDTQYWVTNQMLNSSGWPTSSCIRSSSQRNTQNGVLTLPTPVQLNKSLSLVYRSKWPREQAELRHNVSIPVLLHTADSAYSFNTHKDVMPNFSTCS